jgi:hypothetical protein
MQLVTVTLMLESRNKNLKNRRYLCTIKITIHYYTKTTGYCCNWVNVFSINKSQSDYIKRLPLYKCKLMLKTMTVMLMLKIQNETLNDQIQVEMSEKYVPTCNENTR